MATGGEPGSEAPHSISRESEEYRLQLEYAIWRKERRVHKLETVGILEEQLNRLTVREAGLLKPIPPPPPSPSRSPPARRRLYVDTDLTEGESDNHFNEPSPNRNIAKETRRVYRHEAGPMRGGGRGGQRPGARVSGGPGRKAKTPLLAKLDFFFW